MSSPLPSKPTRCFAEVVALQHTPDQHSVWLTLRVEQPFFFAEGQFLMLTIPDKTRSDGRPLQNPYSIGSSYPLMQEKGLVSFGIKQEGEGGVSDYCVNRLRLGDRVMVTGPLGKHLAYHDAPAHILVAAGSGLAPIRSLYQAIRERGQKIFFAYGEKNLDACHDFVVSQDLGEKNIGSDLIERHIFLSRDDRKGNHGGYHHARVTSLMPMLNDRQKTMGLGMHDVQCYLCGSPAMTEDVTDLLVGGGYDQEKIHAESW